jgi:nucleotide-binding universal stress UspA family protein
VKGETTKVAAARSAESGFRPRPGAPPGRHRRSISYRRIGVCLSADTFSATAVAVACRLADERGSTLTAIAAVEVPLETPLDTVDATVEEAARGAVDDARSIAESYGVPLQGVVLYAREAGAAIVAELASRHTEICVLGAEWPHATGSRRLPPTTDYVLKHARCRVMLIGGPTGRNGLTQRDPVFHAGRPSDYWPAGDFVDRIG